VEFENYEFRRGYGGSIELCVRATGEHQAWTLSDYTARRLHTELSNLLLHPRHCPKCGGSLIATVGDETFLPRHGCSKCELWVEPAALRTA